MAKIVGRKCEEDGNRNNMEIGARYKWEQAEIERKMGMGARCGTEIKINMGARRKWKQDGNAIKMEMGVRRKWEQHRNGSQIEM